jgi:hypothetical protein
MSTYTSKNNEYVFGQLEIINCFLMGLNVVEPIQ